jgi:hypothetical protein
MPKASWKGTPFPWKYSSTGNGHGAPPVTASCTTVGSVDPSFIPWPLADMEAVGIAAAAMNALAAMLAILVLRPMRLALVARPAPIPTG